MGWRWRESTQRNLNKGTTRHPNNLAIRSFQRAANSKESQCLDEVVLSTLDTKEGELNPAQTDRAGTPPWFWALAFAFGNTAGMQH